MSTCENMALHYLARAETAERELTALRADLLAHSKIFDECMAARVEAEMQLAEAKKILNEETNRAGREQAMTPDQFAELLVEHNLVEPHAIDDAEGYDKGYTLGKIRDAHAEIVKSHQQDVCARMTTK